MTRTAASGPPVHLACGGCGCLAAGLFGILVSIAMFVGPSKPGEVPLADKPEGTHVAAVLGRRERAHVLLAGAHADAAKKVWRAWTLHQPSFVGHDPRVPVEVANALELLGRQDELTGGLVTLRESFPPLCYFWMKGYRTRHGQVIDEHDVPTKVFAEVFPGGRLFAISDSVSGIDDPKAKEFLKLTSHSGRLEPLRDVSSTLLYSKYSEGRRTSIPANAVAIVAGPARLDANEIEVWAPIEGAGEEAWAAYRESDGPPPGFFAGSISGVWLPAASDRGKELLGETGRGAARPKDAKGILLTGTLASEVVHPPNEAGKGIYGSCAFVQALALVAAGVLMLRAWWRAR